MAKRRATTELNRDNWDAEEEKEDPGTFKKLSDQELKNRVIRKAKRSLGTVNKEGSGISPFAGFSGFAKSTSDSNPFSFSKGNSENAAISSFKASEDGRKENGNSLNSEEKKSSEAETNSKLKTDSSVMHKSKPTRNIEYYRQLQSLNESVIKWMNLHLAKNSCVDFTPVFNDYKKHLDTLNFTYPVKSEDNSEEKNEKIKVSASLKEDCVSKVSSNNATYEYKFGSDHSDETDYGAHFKSNTTNTSTFSFGIKRTPTATSSTTKGPTTSFEAEAAQEKKPTFQFSFAVNNPLIKNSEDPNSKPFSFASAPTSNNADSGTTEEEEYVPPKNDFVAVKEEDAFYSKRCKLFYKKDEGYVDRGIGVLHLKPLDGKTQLVIRADTSLGNILLNIVLSKSLPMERTGKNNVLLVCIPNPPVDTKNADSKEAIPMLIRVKTSQDADELLETLNKHKS